KETYKMWFLNKMCTSKVCLDDKTVVITGANSGIGKETARDLYARDARVILACRNMEMANEAVEDIKNNPPSRLINNTGELAVYSLDLCSLKSVKDCAKNLLTNEAAIHILINNAGVVAYPSYEKTEDGNEMTLQVNYLGHFLLTLLLLPKMQKSSANCRIVNVSSLTHFLADIDFDNINLERSYSETQCFWMQTIIYCSVDEKYIQFHINFLLLMFIYRNCDVAILSRKANNRQYAIKLWNASCHLLHLEPEEDFIRFLKTVSRQML
ncbi:RDH11 dehydrogenase, partial [Acromyrmex insinuator]